MLFTVLFLVAICFFFVVFGIYLWKEGVYPISVFLLGLAVMVGLVTLELPIRVLAPYQWTSVICKILTPSYVMVVFVDQHGNMQTLKSNEAQYHTTNVCVMATPAVDLMGRTNLAYKLQVPVLDNGPEKE